MGQQGIECMVSTYRATGHRMCFVSMDKQDVTSVVFLHE